MKSRRERENGEDRMLQIPRFHTACDLPFLCFFCAYFGPLLVVAGSVLLDDVIYACYHYRYVLFAELGWPIFKKSSYRGTPT